MEIHLINVQKTQTLQEHSREAEGNLFSKHYTVYIQLGNAFLGTVSWRSKVDNKAKTTFLGLPEKERNSNRQVLLSFNRI